MTRHVQSHGRGGAAAVLAMLLVLAVGAGRAGASGPGINGRVLGLDEKGNITGVVSGAVIELTGRAGKRAATATTDKNGFYRLDLPPGTYTYSVRAEGYKNETAGRGITLQLSDGYAVYNFSLVKGKSDPDTKPPVIPILEIGELRGRVQEKTPEGRLVPIPEARIFLRKRGSPRVVEVGVRKGEVDIAGRYVVSLETGIYTASVLAPGFDTFIDPEAIRITAGGTEIRNYLLSRIRPPSSKGQGIRGVVRLIQPSPPLRTLPEVKLLILPQGDPDKPIGPFGPEAGGKFARDLTPGRYQVVAQAEGFITAYSGPRDVFSGRYTIVDLTLTPTRPVKPPVTELAFLATVFERLPGTAKTKPLAGASVLLRRKGMSLDGAQRGTTDIEGKVRLKVTTAGTYEALVRLSGYEDAAVQVEIRAEGDNRADIELRRRVDPMRRVNLRVDVVENLPSRVQPLAGAQIVVSQQGKTITSGRADDAGRRAFSLPAGTYRIEVTLAGFMPAGVDVKLEAEDAERKIALVRRPAPVEKVTLMVRTVERVKMETRPVAGAQVKITQEGRTIASGTTDDSGVGSFSLPPGSYRVEVSRMGFGLNRFDVTLMKETVRREVMLVRRGSP